MPGCVLCGQLQGFICSCGESTTELGQPVELPFQQAFLSPPTPPPVFFEPQHKFFLHASGVPAGYDVAHQEPFDVKLEDGSPFDFDGEVRIEVNRGQLNADWCKFSFKSGENTVRCNIVRASKDVFDDESKSVRIRLWHKPVKVHMCIYNTDKIIDRREIRVFCQRSNQSASTKPSGKQSSAAKPKKKRPYPESSLQGSSSYSMQSTPPNKKMRMQLLCWTFDVAEPGPAFEKVKQAINTLQFEAVSLVVCPALTYAGNENDSSWLSVLYYRVS